MSVTLERPITLEMTRHFDASPERVFDAWLDGSWGEWAGPPGIKGEVTLLEPCVGGRYRIVMHRPDGGTLTVGGTYDDIVRPSRIVMSWKWEHEETDTLLTLTFQARNGGTDLTLHHTGFAAADRRDGHNMGWIGTLDKLADYLAR